jgi:hypothetical protein
MSKVKEQNYVVIQGWMLSKLQLKGNDLLIYAIIYGFSQNVDCKFTGVLNSLKNLLDFYEMSNNDLFEILAG